MTGTEWQRVIEDMEEVGPYYERVNWLITFGLVERWRKKVASLASREDSVLELGSGPGNFTRLLECRNVYALEPSDALLQASRKAVESEKVTFVRGVGEKIPLADGSVDKVFCVFSFRDFFDRKTGTEEMHRVLKAGGEVVIVDMAKPPPGPLSRMLGFHVKHMVPPLTRVAVPSVARERWSRDPYRTLLDTYDAFGSTKVHEDLLRGAGFSDVSTEFLEMRGATMTRGKKPWKSTS
jgi:demethylmenaquinone methyltransferase/2-methoxy-6-polyprenyl-1,4-benzoquinol methylase